MMIIDLGNTTRARIIDGVIGQLSDGKWENSGMRKYWHYCHTQGTDLIIDNDSWDSGFRGRNEDWIKQWFAGKLKAAVQDEVGNNKHGWSRANMKISEYISYNHDMTVSHCYECYDYLLGRTGHKYAFKEIAQIRASIVSVKYKQTISSSIIKTCESLELDTSVPGFQEWADSILEYYINKYDELTTQEFDDNLLLDLKNNIKDETLALKWPTYSEISAMIKRVYYHSSSYIKSITEEYNLSLAADDCFKAMYFATIKPEMLVDLKNYINSNKDTL